MALAVLGEESGGVLAPSAPHVRTPMLIRDPPILYVLIKTLMETKLKPWQ